MTTESNLPKTIVASGSYVIDQKKDTILEALLGTCVGVTLCDRAADIGGLIHILLPKPTLQEEKTWAAEKYASVGLPKFIQALIHKGAQKERLEACIAGGALFGPVSDMDITLDIGGRTVEVVHSILREESIPIFQSEIGGCFSCRLKLNMKTWETSITPLNNTASVPSGEESCTGSKKIEKNKLAEAIQHTRPIPQIALKILRMVNEGNYNLNEVAHEIRQDQIISARVINLVNSTFIGMREKIDSIDRALVIIGERQLMQIVISAALAPMFPDTALGYSLSMGGLFQHSLGTAIMAEEISGFTKQSSPPIAYTAGLLHDIGKVVLDQYIAQANPLFYRKTLEEGANLVSTEHELLGVDHTEVGVILAQRWDLPENLIEVIQNHHSPERAEVSSMLTHQVYLADLLMSKFQVGRELDCLDTNDLLPRLGQAGLSPDQLPIIIDRIPQKIFEYSLPLGHSQ